MEPDFSKYRLEGDNSMYRLPSGLVAPVVTRAGQDLDVPGRYRGDAIEHRINHSPVEASASSLAACRAQRSQRRRLANLLNPSAADY